MAQQNFSVLRRAKIRTRTEHYTVPHTVDGTTVNVPRERHIPLPKLPRDWDRSALRVTAGIVLALTLVAVAWSTVSIGNVLGGGVGYLAATVFDAAWAICLLLEWMARFSPAKRTFPRNLGWLLLLLTMGAIFWNGILSNSIAMAVVGAVVSFVAKVLWLGVTRHIDKELSPDDAYWVAAQISAANAKMAVAQARRQAARIEHQAVAEILAMEADSGITTQLLVNQEEPAQSGPSPTVRSAVRAAIQTMPDATPDDIVEQLARIGVDVTTDTVRDLSGQPRDTQDTRSEATMTDLIRGLAALGVRDRDTVLAAVRTTLGPETKESSVIRILNRTKG